jgi:hypothetical protein
MLGRSNWLPHYLSGVEAMPIQTLKNPYQGINAHLNSLLQTPGTDSSPSLWQSFHSSQIAHIADFLNGVLPPNYVALSEQSLQIRTEHLDGERLLQRTPDVAIYGYTSANPVTPTTTSAPVEFALEQALDVEEHYVKAVVIRQVDEHTLLGNVVARLELLSPSNKPGHSGYEAYRHGRNEALYSFIPLIELDYLHETLLPYNATRPQAYAIIISDPRPSVAVGRAKFFGFDVDTPFPPVDIPLAGSDTLPFDFGAVYQYTFERGRWGMYADYSLPPARFETYSASDQKRIQVVMQRVSML